MEGRAMTQARGTGGWRTRPDELTGSIAPVVTPFTADGEVDHQSLAALVSWQIRQGSDGISIGGSTGEPSAQTVAERAEAIRTVITVADGRVPVIPGTGSAKLDETIELTGAAYEEGVDAVLIITPYYARPTQDALYVWYQTVAAEYPDLPIIAYNVPSRTAVEIAPETVARLHRDVANFVGIKETTKDFEHFSRVIKAAGRDLLMWSGIELLCLPLLALGGTGFISATANIAPAATKQMYDAYRGGRFDEALDLHYGLHPLVDLIFVETNPAPVKWVLQRRGLINSEFVRPPLITPTDAGKQKIVQLLAEGAAYLSPVDESDGVGTRVAAGGR